MTNLKSRQMHFNHSMRSAAMNNIPVKGGFSFLQWRGLAGAISCCGSKASIKVFESRQKRLSLSISLD
jgi:hypothetical protein